jgi:hypothetical protein
MKRKTIKLDWTRLLGFDQTPEVTGSGQSAGRLGAKVGSKDCSVRRGEPVSPGRLRDPRMAKVGTKPDIKKV